MLMMVRMFMLMRVRMLIYAEDTSDASAYTDADDVADADDNFQAVLDYNAKNREELRGDSCRNGNTRDAGTLKIQNCNAYYFGEI